MVALSSTSAEAAITGVVVKSCFRPVNPDT